MEATQTSDYAHATTLLGIQVASLVAPIGYLIYSVRSPRTLLTANRFLRTTWIGGATGGIIGAATGFYQVAAKGPTFLRERRQELTYDVCPSVSFFDISSFYQSSI